MTNALQLDFDVVVVGAGHAGCEAALAAARLGQRVGLVTMRADRVAQMSCNPAIGGVGKGHLVREIDALGGAMAQIADATGIQFRRLNTSRGAAVRSTRCQSDSKRYRVAMTERLEATPGVVLIEDEVVDLPVGDGRIRGVVGARNGLIASGAVVITTGTFLNGLCHMGEDQFAGGRIGDAPASQLSDGLRRAGLTLHRFKTGTTPRLLASSIAWERLEAQEGDQPPPRFSFEPVENRLSQVCCYLTHTTEATHEVIRNNLHRSPLFQGQITGRGPRYCPSIEDKVVRFAERTQHTIFLEPEGLDSERIYPNGISTSLPRDVQEAFLRTIPGLEEAEILQHGYAVEYDFAQPTQLQMSLETKVCRGLFLAGQINGTSGYEEAAAQGLVAGVNAAHLVAGREPLILPRHQAYIGVLLDDLVTKGVDEPYRIFTSRAEYRLLLRESNAEERLLETGNSLGLLPAGRYERAIERRRVRDELRAELERTRVGQLRATSLGLGAREAALTRSELLRRPEISIEDVAPGHALDAGLLVEEEIKYEGYIARELGAVERLREMEQLVLPEGVSYRGAAGLSTELQEKLDRVRPSTLGQASRIPGMTPAALSILRYQAHRASPRPPATT